MITIKNENLKSSKLNVLAGRDLVFDANGVCKDAPEDLAILVFPHAGMKVDGLSEKAKASAEKRKNGIEHAKRAQRKGAYQRGLPEPAHVTNPEPYRGVIGKEVGKPAVTNAGQKLSDGEAEALAKAEEEAILAVRTPPGDEGEFDTMEEREARLKAQASAPASSGDEESDGGAGGEVSEEGDDETSGEEEASEEESAEAPKKAASSLKGKPKKKGK